MLTLYSYIHKLCSLSGQYVDIIYTNIEVQLLILLRRHDSEVNYTRYIHKKCIPVNPWRCLYAYTGVSK